MSQQFTYDHNRYTLAFENGLVLPGKLDPGGYALHSPVPDSPARVQYQLPEPDPDRPWPPHEVLQSLLDQEGTPSTSRVGTR